MSVPNTNDGSQAAPYLRCDINWGNVANLPAESSGPRGDDRSIHQAIKDAGYQGIQGGQVDICRELGLGVMGGGRINQPAEAAVQAQQLQDAGFEGATFHVGWGMESDAEAAALVEAIIDASEKTQFPMYIETHRATITQDIRRTYDLVAQFPDIRFNGDFSHWYTGLEMVYGDIEAKFDFLNPVFDRVRFIHARIGNPGCMQVDIGDGKDRSYVEHFKEMWTRSFAGFLKTAQPGDFISFNPELLQPEIYYARTIINADGKEVEESDRWQQAALYTEIAKECFAAAQSRVGAAAKA